MVLTVADYFSTIRPKIRSIQAREIALREKVAAAGIKKFERLKLERKGEEDDEYECGICNANLYLSLVSYALLYVVDTPKGPIKWAFI